MLKTLQFNGKAYASSAPQDPCGFNGIFKKHRNGNVSLFTLEGKLAACLINNDRQGRFAVTASTASDGKPFYMHSTCSLTEKWLGIESMTCAGLSASIAQILIE